MSSSGSKYTMEDFKASMKKLSIRQYILILSGFVFFVLGLVIIGGIKKWGSSDLETAKKANNGVLMMSTFSTGYTLGKFLIGSGCKVWAVPVKAGASDAVKAEAETLSHTKKGLDFGGILGSLTIFILAIIVQVYVDKQDLEHAQNAAIGIMVMGLLVMMYAAFFSYDFKVKEE